MPEIAIGPDEVWKERDRIGEELWPAGSAGFKRARIANALDLGELRYVRERYLSEMDPAVELSYRRKKVRLALGTAETLDDYLAQLPYVEDCIKEAKFGTERSEYRALHSFVVVATAEFAAGRIAYLLRAAKRYDNAEYLYQARRVSERVLKLISAEEQPGVEELVDFRLRIEKYRDEAQRLAPENLAELRAGVERAFFRKIAGREVFLALIAGLAIGIAVGAAVVALLS